MEVYNNPSFGPRFDFLGFSGLASFCGILESTVPSSPGTMGLFAISLYKYVRLLIYYHDGEASKTVELHSNLIKQPTLSVAIKVPFCWTLEAKRQDLPTIAQSADIHNTPDKPRFAFSKISCYSSA